MFGKGLSTFILPKKTILIYGIMRGTTLQVMPGAALQDTSTADMKMTNMSFHGQEDGGITQLTGKISGSRIMSAQTGVPIITEGGYGHHITDITGILMIHGDLSPITTEDGTGILFGDGTGSRVTGGHLHGYRGAIAAIIGAGHL
ncbi:MAG: hypothetical protein C5S38_01670 [Candidatus Methanophagaceae archaeon]|nr:MAG: hypothetical protein C5S38_01670 [Methanophagales archaeon]